ncbi:MAG: nucleotidyltransferase family protein [Deltaproteobacteria bacterium]|nr:nucleotidyltransferase family protein [Deltaproteobacteria bacterium]
MIKELCRTGDCSLMEAMKQMDSVGLGVLFVIDENGSMIGMFTDGDLRRIFLRGVSLETSLYSVMNRDFSFWPAEKSREEGIQYLRRIKRRHMAVLDGSWRIIDILLLDELALQPRDNLVVIMAGGLGKRLRPLTEECPKPLLKVGDKPLLETIITNFSESGFGKFYLSINYMSEMIEEYFGNGSQWGVEIEYLRESKQMGTAGALSLITKKPRLPFLVMNGDVLSRVNLEQLIEFHERQQAVATMCVRKHDFKVPYGVITVDEHRILSIEEKPIYSVFINAGIYVFSPEILNLIPSDSSFDMPELFEILLAQRRLTVAFPVREYWKDIGHIDEYISANGEFRGLFL